MKKTKEQKAITLIALIITIVVLLILAVVAINAVTGDGIIQHASNAKTEYEKAQDEEKGVLSYYEQYLESEGKLGDWIQNKTIVKNVKTGQILEVGDYVNYDETKVGTVEVPKNVEWRVLGTENGQILLMSASDVTTETLSGKKDYINNVGVNRLNTICTVYGNGEGAETARSIKVEDIDRVTGYNPLKTGTGDIYYHPNVGRLSQYLNKVTYTLTEDGKVYYSSATASAESSYSRFVDVDGTELIKASVELSDGKSKSIVVDNNYYSYYGKTLTMEEQGEIKGLNPESNAYELLFADENGTYREYWLASSIVCTLKGYVDYGIHIISAGRVFGDILWKTSTDTVYSPDYGVRAVVKLNSKIELEDENGIWQIK